MQADRFPKIQDYGVIGDCRSAALISRFGSVDWLCWPRFDSPAIFAALLDRQKGGSWSIAPTHDFTSDRRYVPDTNILQTHFRCASGSLTLTDLMPIASEAFKSRNLLPAHEIIRRVVCTSGKVDVSVAFQPREDYGARPVRLRNCNSLGLFFESKQGVFFLRSSHPLVLENGTASGVFALQHNDVLEFSLSYSEECPAVLPALGASLECGIQRTAEWWQDWAGRCSYQGPYKEEVMRSALALKLLTYSPSGAIAAAATTSLPEVLGGSLNWDYRYCWLRDASLTVRAFVDIGYVEEAESFLLWLLNATQLTRPKVNILYTFFGQQPPEERELNHLSGYRHSWPVRVGNAAKDQIQLDVYGEIIDAAAQCARAGIRFDRGAQRVLVSLGKYIAANWDQPDEGIWEPRTGPQHHTHSRLLCWVALDRLLAMEKKGLIQDVPRERFCDQRERIRAQLQERAWNSDLRSYVSTLDGDEVDASALLIPWYGFDRPDSDRMKQTYECVMKNLGAGNHLLYRYARDPREGAFGICAFWAVEYLAQGGGTLEDAHQAFLELRRYQNDLGLFSEEIEPRSGDALGNFPQAFTHIGLISAAVALEEREQGMRQPSEKTGEDVETPVKGSRT